MKHNSLKLNLVRACIHFYRVVPKLKEKRIVIVMICRKLYKKPKKILNGQVRRRS